MNKTRKRTFTALLIALAAALVLALSLGIFCACAGDTDGKADANGAWYYGAAAPADELGQEGDFYLNTQTLSSYKKTAAGWTMALEADEVGAWLYGVGEPDGTAGKAGDFYLDTASGDLYHKGAEGWGEPVLKLFGKNGRDGVLWFSGENPDPNTFSEGDTAVKDAIAGDFYLDTENFEVWQKNAEGKWDDLGSLKGPTGEAGVSPKLEGFLTGKGVPDESLGAEKDFYLDTESGEIWQKGSVSWSKKGSLGDLSASHIKEIQYNTRSWGVYHGFNKILNRDDLGELPDYYSDIDPVYGYWIIFDDNSALFIQKHCTHSISGSTQNAPITLYNDDCTYGTVQILKCAYCGETVTMLKDPTRNPNHHYAEAWTSDETDHWHALTCAHKDAPVQKLGHVWREYYTVDYDEAGKEVKGYVKWRECSVCGYVEKVIDLEKLVQADVLHISNVDEWNAFATAVNNGDTYGEGKKFSEAKVELDGDINFGGMELIPVGVPTNAADVTDRTNGAYLDLKAEAHIEGGFSGHFDGKGHKISGFTLDSGNFTGLFGYLNNATVTDFTVENATVTGDAFVGAVAGFIAGTDVRISKVTVVDTKVTGLVHVGGIAGYAKNAGPQVTKASATDEAAIKNCTVMSTKGTALGRDSATIVKTAFANEPDSDGYYFDGTNAGGILGTSYSSSVIGCYVKEILVQGGATSTSSAIVGYAEGTAEAKSVVVGNIVSIQSGIVNIFNGTNYYTKDGLRRVPADGGRGKYKTKVQKLGLAYAGDLNGNGDNYVHHKKYIAETDPIHWETFVVKSGNEADTTKTPYEGAGE